MAFFFLIICVTSSTSFLSIAPKLTLPDASILISPDNKVSFSLSINSALPLLPNLLNGFFTNGNIASMCLSSLRACSPAKLMSPARAPMFCLSISKKACDFLPRGRNTEKNLSRASLLEANSSRLLASDLTADPVPPINPKNNAPSTPNLTLFAISLDARFSSLGSSSVGPAPIMSPNVPTPSGSPTKIASVAPTPAAPPSVASNLPFAFKDVLNFSWSTGSVSLK